jgi:predicted DNA binding CopG/RHH family protein
MSAKPNRLSQQLAARAAKHETEEPKHRSVAESMRTPDSPLNSYLSARTTSDFRDDVKMYALRSGMSFQDLLHEALEEYMQRHPVN